MYLPPVPLSAKGTRMHMSDALLSPAVGGLFWVGSAALVVAAARKIAKENDERMVPLMGVAGAFVFAAQMINFTIPGTGSSGHLGGGLLLALLLGPWRAFLVLSSVLTVQALLFADGGLLALGCNVFNLAFFPAFVALPFIYKPLSGGKITGIRAHAATIAAAVAGLLMGAFAVVLQTVFSGVSDLSFGMFTAFMLPIHRAIGVVEGVVTAGVIALVARAQPGILQTAAQATKPRRAAWALLALALSVGGLLSWFASSHPDGLEWSIGKTTGVEELQTPDKPLYRLVANLQKATSLLPDYGFGGEEPTGESANSPVSLGTTVSGLVGSLLVLALGAILGVVLGARKRHGSDTAPAAS
jgi:cobalt/nickel transport system permease protein